MRNISPHANLNEQNLRAGVSPLRGHGRQKAMLPVWRVERDETRTIEPSEDFYLKENRLGRLAKSQCERSWGAWPGALRPVNHRFLCHRIGVKYNYLLLIQISLFETNAPPVSGAAISTGRASARKNRRYPRRFLG